MSKLEVTGVDRHAGGATVTMKDQDPESPLVSLRLTMRDSAGEPPEVGTLFDLDLSQIEHVEEEEEASVTPPVQAPGADASQPAAPATGAATAGAPSADEPGST